MNEGNELFSPHRRRREEEALEQRLQAIEAAIGRVAGYRSAIVDPITGQVTAVGSEGSSAVGDGGGGGGAIATHGLLDDAYHTDTETSAPSLGAMIYGKTASLWGLLAAGTNDYFLRMVAGLPEWVQLAFSMVTGTLQSGQHGSLSDGDHTGDLSGNARVNVKKAGTSVGIRRGINLIEGAGIVLTVADDGANEEVDVTVAASGGGAATFTTQESNSTVEASTDTLNFGSGFDVTNPSAGKASVALDLSEVATGDVEYTANAGKVVAIQNKAIAAPTSAEDEKAVAYDHGTGEFVYVNREAFVLGLWSRSDISTGAGSEMRQVGASGNNHDVGFVPARDGYVTGLSVATDGDIGGVGDNYVVTLYKNGLNTLAQLTLTGTAGTDTKAWTTTGGGALPVAFSAGDVLTLVDGESGSLNARAARAFLHGYYS